VSTICDDVRSALDEGLEGTDAICEATGYDKRQVVNALYQIKAAAKQNGHTEPPKPRVVPPAAKAKELPVAPAKPKRLNTEVVVSGDRLNEEFVAGSTMAPHPSIEVGRFGEYVVIKRSDLAELAELFKRIERWRNAIEAA
jgi:hypothetical protein